MNALQLMIYLGLMNHNYPANVNLLFENLLSFVNYDLYKADDLNNKIFDFKDDNPLTP